MAKVAKNSAERKGNPKTKERAAAIEAADAERFVRGVMATDLHAARVASLSRSALGVAVAGSLAIHAIGRGLAAAENLTDKHAIKQVDRLLSNDGIDPWALAAQWVPFMVGKRQDVVVNFDHLDPRDVALERTEGFFLSEKPSLRTPATVVERPICRPVAPDQAAASSS